MKSYDTIIIHRGNLSFQIPLNPMSSRRYIKGGGGGGGSKTYQGTKTQRSTIDDLLKNVYGPTVGQGQNVYGGQRVADFNQMQQGSLDQAQGFMNSFKPGQGMPLFGETGNTLQDILSGNTGADQLSMGQANDSFNQQYANPAYRNFRQNTSPLLQEQFAGPGFWSSARAGAVGDAAGDLGSQLEAQRAGYLWETEQTNRQLQEAAAARQQAGVSQAMQYGMMPTQQNLANLQGTQSLFDFGQQQQMQEQTQINSDMQKFAEENRITDPENMQIIMELLNATTGGSGRQANTSSTWGVL